MFADISFYILSKIFYIYIICFHCMLQLFKKKTARQHVACGRPDPPYVGRKKKGYPAIHLKYMDNRENFTKYGSFISIEQFVCR